MSKKATLAALLNASGIGRPLRRLISNRLVVFNYHRIRPDDPVFESPYDDDVFGPSVTELKQHLSWLKVNFRILSEAELIESLNSGSFPAELNVMITFDDGYADNYSLAYPVLKELGVPAVFFIPTEMISSRRLGWWDITAYLLKQTSRAVIGHYGARFYLPSELRTAIRYFHSILQLMRPDQIDQFLTDLAEYCDVPLPDLGEQGDQLMRWEEIRTVSKNGIAIGSHTHSHPTLASLTPEEQKTEMIRSARALKAETGIVARSIAYPLGGSRHISEDTGRIAAEAGYQAGFTFKTGYNPLAKLDRYNLKRISGPGDLNLLSGAVLFPSIFTWDA